MLKKGREQNWLRKTCEKPAIFDKMKKERFFQENLAEEERSTFTLIKIISYLLNLGVRKSK